MKKYTYLFAIIFIVLIQSCGSTAKTQDKKETETNEKVDDNSNYIIGEVKLNHRDCEIVIVTEEDTPEKLYPVSLDDMFKVDGAFLQFEFDPSRAPLPEGCEQTRAVVLRNVTRLKR